MRAIKFQFIKNFSKKGFSLIELMVATLILALVMAGMVAVSVSGFMAYQKSRAIKIVTEDVGFALNSIAKDVSMGKIESQSPNTGKDLASRLIVRRNIDGIQVCYKIEDDRKKIIEVENSDISCNPPSGESGKILVDLSSAGMEFDDTSGFRSQKTAASIRGWAGINLNIDSPGMETDSIQVQTTISSRDYGWENTP